VGSNYGDIQLAQKHADELPGAHWHHMILLLQKKAVKADLLLLRFLLGNI